MNLKCRIKDKEFKIVQGATFADEYNETLDSGSIIITDIEKLYDLKPYDDVFIWNADEEFNGYDIINKNPNQEMPSFYKHMLVDQFSEDIIRFGTPDGNGNYIGTKYKYKIQLFSETKRLETVQLPNISITQPLNINKKKSVYEYLLMFNDMYSPLIKVVDNEEEKTWKYIKRYAIDPNLETTFGDVYAPDFTLNNPNYRDLLAKLLLVKDCIPYVKNDVIKALNITERGKDFDIDRKYITRVIGSRSSNDFCDNLKRTYSDALGQDESCRYVEHLGFRNSSAALMTIANMQIETRYPIYKINKVYMCYYKKVTYNDSDLSKIVENKLYKVGDMVKITIYKDLSIIGGIVPEEKTFVGKCIKEHISLAYSDSELTDYDGYWYWHYQDGKNAKINEFFEEFKINRIILCKQDITPLVKLNSERNLLSQDWNEFKNNPPFTIEEMSRYKMTTVEYSIGSNIISGWGTKYTYPEGWWDINKSYIENIIVHIDNLYPFGIYSLNYIVSGETQSNVEKTYYESFSSGDLLENTLLTPFSYDYGLIGDFTDFITQGQFNATKLKSFFFEIDYNGFYSGTVIHSKDISDDDITINDNASESLTLLEQDGLFQKEKINRFGNKAIQIFARYTHSNQRQELGSVYNYDGETDVIIYRREYSIFDKEISCVYYGTKDYVLKNYFTTVFARHRTYNLMSYGESVRRAENRKMFLLISKDKNYFENENKKMLFENFDGNYLDKILSFYKNSPQARGKNNFILNDKINYGVLKHNDKYYASDINVFVSGYSLCFNLAMYDNVSSGIYIKKANPFENRTSKWDVLFNIQEDYTGSVQDWYMMIDDVETGFTKELGFYVFHVNDDYGDLEKPSIDDTEENKQKIYDIYKNKLLKLPYLDKLEDNISNKIGMQYEINKDNKEVIDMTFQIEPITNTEDIMFSQWLMKLSDLNGNYHKVQKEYTTQELYAENAYLRIRYGTSTFGVKSEYEFEFFANTSNPLMLLEFKKDGFDNFKGNEKINLVVNYAYPIEMYQGAYEGYKISKYKLVFKEIISKEDDTLKLKADQYITVVQNVPFAFEQEQVLEDVIITFNKKENSNDENFYQFVNYKQFTNNTEVLKYYELLEENRISYIDYQGNTQLLPTVYCLGQDIYKDFIPSYTNFVASPTAEIATTNAYDAEIKFIFGGAVIDSDKNIISEESILLNATNVNSVLRGVTKQYTYEKNIFIKLSPEKMKKTIVYDELKELKADKYGESISSKVEDYISIVDDKMIIQGLSEVTQSVQVWYYDEKSESYHFVFGVNKEPGNYSMELNISMVSTKNTKVYDENYNLVGNVTNKGDGIQHYE